MPQDRRPLPQRTVNLKDDGDVLHGRHIPSDRPARQSICHPTVVITDCTKRGSKSKSKKAPGIKRTTAGGKVNAPYPVSSGRRGWQARGPEGGRPLANPANLEPQTLLLFVYESGTLLFDSQNNVARNASDDRGASVHSAGKVRFGSSSGHLLPNVELERRVRFRPRLNAEPELAFRNSALTLNDRSTKCASKKATMSAPKWRENYRLRWLSVRGSVRFNQHFDCPNAEPERGVRFSQCLNLEPEPGVQFSSVQTIPPTRHLLPPRRSRRRDLYSDAIFDNSTAYDSILPPLLAFPADGTAPPPRRFACFTGERAVPVFADLFCELAQSEPPALCLDAILFARSVTCPSTSAMTLLYPYVLFIIFEMAYRSPLNPSRASRIVPRHFVRCGFSSVDGGSSSVDEGSSSVDGENIPNWPILPESTDARIDSVLSHHHLVSPPTQYTGAIKVQGMGPSLTRTFEDGGRNTPTVTPDATGSFGLNAPWKSIVHIAP
ncbi:hypothetical protein B0H16DRAFT_1701522 [Mycena metata]|uniref:Uncharacterized protein n=1 Tax=Mycena metata TaxID=1033252 RepID=A0AAD7HA24_9AGAR|nr:hypothetical protein B0H16DRAFT_1701522 [Mycena metata]